MINQNKIIKIECAVCTQEIELNQELFKRGLTGEPLCDKCEGNEEDAKIHV